MANPKAYLIVAYYNRYKWRNASTEQLDQAEDAAEDLFPEKPNRLTDLASQGVMIAQTFDSDLFDKVASSYSKLLTALQGVVQTVVQEQIVAASIIEIPRDVRDQIVDGIYATQSIEVPVGWMVVVDEKYFTSYIDRMSGAGNEKGLWSVFDIEIIPLAEGWSDENVRSLVPRLRGDQTTQEVYDFMTPTSWNH